MINDELQAKVDEFKSSIEKQLILTVANIIAEIKRMDVFDILGSKELRDQIYQENKDEIVQLISRDIIEENELLKSDLEMWKEWFKTYKDIK
jgi:hypothetical protein